MQFTLNVPNTFIIEKAKGTTNYVIYKLQITTNKGVKRIIKRLIYTFKGTMKESSYTKARKYIKEEFGETSAEQFARTKNYEWVSLWDKVR